jgi:3'(2'), 5'-bisphosphate nucleotidase
VTDAELARALAGAAGALLLEVQADTSLTGKALGAAGDAAANRLLVERLRRERPDDALLSEEEKDDRTRCTASRVWIIDPLDGTREFGEGREDWAVHVALAIDGAPVVGAVAMPARGEIFCTARTPSLPAPAATPRMMVSRSRPPAEAVAVAEAIGAELIPMGSAGAKAMAVVRGDAEIYLHSGGQYEWDSCAPVAVALAHGLHASRLDGSPLVYNGHDLYLPDVLICRREWAEPILNFLAARGLR